MTENNTQDYLVMDMINGSPSVYQALKLEFAE
jgi:hypothetical protein